MADETAHTHGQQNPQNQSTEPPRDETKKPETNNTSDLHPKPKSAPIDKQRTHIEQLMQRIDKPIDLPQSKKPTLRPPPEIVLNVRGSSAGAGSSDFHTYRELRRKEHLRIKLMDVEAKEDLASERFNEELESLKRKDEEKTAKNRAKRQKRKNKSDAKDSKDAKHVKGPKDAKAAKVDKDDK